MKALILVFAANVVCAWFAWNAIEEFRLPPTIKHATIVARLQDSVSSISKQLHGVSAEGYSSMNPESLGHLIKKYEDDVLLWHTLPPCSMEKEISELNKAREDCLKITDRLTTAPSDDASRKVLFETLKECSIFDDVKKERLQAKDRLWLAEGFKIKEKAKYKSIIMLACWFVCGITNAIVFLRRKKRHVVFQT